MCVVFLAVKMDLCVGLRCLCLEERQTAYEPLKVADPGGGRNNVCSQRSRKHGQLPRSCFAHDRRPELECLKLFRTSQLPPESPVATPIVHSIRHIDLPQ